MQTYHQQPWTTPPDEARPTLDALRAPWIEAASRERYVYGFSWMGRPIVQLPQDIVALQELHAKVRPDLVIETGVAHGGSLLLHASMQRLWGTAPRVLGIDIEIRDENRAAIEAHPMSRGVELLESSSTATAAIQRAQALAERAERVMVILDSNHSHEHVAAELDAYADLVSPASYCVVFDTAIEDLPAGFFQNRPWDKGSNPRTAVDAFLRERPEFRNDDALEARLSLTAAPGGWLVRQ